MTIMIIIPAAITTIISSSKINLIIVVIWQVQLSCKTEPLLSTTVSGIDSNETGSSDGKCE